MFTEYMCRRVTSISSAVSTNQMNTPKGGLTVSLTNLWVPTAQYVGIKEAVHNKENKNGGKKGKLRGGGGGREKAGDRKQSHTYTQKNPLGKKKKKKDKDKDTVKNKACLHNWALRYNGKGGGGVCVCVGGGGGQHLLMKGWLKACTGLKSQASTHWKFLCSLWCLKPSQQFTFKRQHSFTTQSQTNQPWWFPLRLILITLS